MLEVKAIHEPRSSGRESAPSYPKQGQSRLTSAATVPGFKARKNVSGNSPQLRWRRGGNVSATVRTNEPRAAGDQKIHGQTLATGVQTVEYGTDEQQSNQEIKGC